MPPKKGGNPKKGGSPARVLGVMAALVTVAAAALLYLQRTRPAGENPAGRNLSAEESTSSAAQRPVPPSRSPDPPPENPGLYKPDPAVPARESSGPPPRVPLRNYPGPRPGEPALMALILDDAGYDMAALERAMRMKVPLTFSVLPFSPHGEEAAREAHRRGFEVWLHLPMEPENASADPGEGAVLAHMSREEATGAVLDALKVVPYIKGVNNHMGSKATRDARLMKWVLAPVRDWGLMFIDSKTSPDTAAFETAKSMGLACSIRDVFLDTVPDFQHSMNELRRLEETARLQGTAIGIGHFYPSTLQALETFLPGLDPEKTRLVPASEIVDAENAPLEL